MVAEKEVKYDHLYETEELFHLSKNRFLELEAELVARDGVSP